MSVPTQGPAKILLVDDDELSSEVISSLLKRALPAADIRCAANGNAGLALFQEIRPHVLITDLRMPGMCGAELIETIRASDVTTPILVITGAPEAKGVPGATEVILKTEFRHLIERTKSLLTESGAGSIQV